MKNEIIEKIVLTEILASDLVSSSSREASNLILNAKSENEKKIEDLVIENRKKQSQLISQEDKRLKQIYDSNILKIKSDSFKLKEKANKNFDKAIDIILTGVFNGDC